MALRKINGAGLAPAPPLVYSKVAEAASRIFRPNCMARGPPEPSTGFEFTTSD